MRSVSALAPTRDEKMQDKTKSRKHSCNEEPPPFTDVHKRKRHSFSPTGPPAHSPQQGVIISSSGAVCQDSESSGTLKTLSYRMLARGPALQKTDQWAIASCVTTMTWFGSDEMSSSCFFVPTRKNFRSSWGLKSRMTSRAWNSSAEISAQ